MGIIIKAIRRSYSSDIRKEDENEIINDFMERHKITKYIINPDKSVDVDGYVFIYGSDLINGKIPFKFGTVSGDFDCSCCGLTSLENCPDLVYCTFACHNNKLTSLEGCPKGVFGSFYCGKNKRIFSECDILSVCHVYGNIYND